MQFLIKPPFNAGVTKWIYVKVTQAEIIIRMRKLRARCFSLWPLLWPHSPLICSSDTLDPQLRCFFLDVFNLFFTLNSWTQVFFRLDLNRFSMSRADWSHVDIDYSIKLEKAAQLWNDKLAASCLPIATNQSHHGKRLIVSKQPSSQQSHLGWWSNRNWLF